MIFTWVIMAPGGGHIGFAWTIFIVVGLSWNFYSGCNIAKEVDWAVRLSVRKSFSNTSPSILDLHLNQAHQWKCRKPIFEFHFRSALKSKIRKKHDFLVGLCRRVFFNTSSILALHPNEEHQCIRIVKMNRMVKTVFRISFFFLFWNLILKNMHSSILVLNRKQAHQRIHHIETNKIFIIIFNECSEFHFCSVLKSKIPKKDMFSGLDYAKRFCQYFFNNRSTSKSSKSMD